MANLNTCTAKNLHLEKMIQRFDLLIKNMQASYKITIDELTSSYQTRIVRLKQVISGLESEISKMSGSTTTITVTISNNTTDINRYTNEIKSLRDKIKLLIEQKLEIMRKMDTIDCNSITLIVEYKKQVTNYESDINDYYEQIVRMEGMISTYSEENAKLNMQLEFYKSNSDYYRELVEKYSEINSDQDKYIKELEKLVKKYQLKDKDGQVIDVTIIINKNDGDRVLIEQLHQEIKQINIQITNIKNEYNNSITIIKNEYTKNITDCKNSKGNCENQVIEWEEKCNNRVEKMKKELLYHYDQYYMQIKINYQSQLNDYKKCCDRERDPTPDNITDINNTYNFEIYKRHCLILIDKNTANDCKAISEIRTVYNEKCIMTSLPSGTKDLTTFASSDFSDDRNALMMKRLNSSK